MSTLQVPSTLYVKTIDTAEVIPLGGVTLARDCELGHVTALLYIKGVLAGGTERIRVKVYAKADYAMVLHTSDWSDLADLTPVPATDWLGWVRMDFARQNLASGTEYFLALETGNYTRNADTYYLSTVFDWPAPVNEQSEAPRYAAAFALYGYEEPNRFLGD